MDVSTARVCCQSMKRLDRIYKLHIITSLAISDSSGTDEILSFRDRGSKSYDQMNQTFVAGPIHGQAEQSRCWRWS